MVEPELPKLLTWVRFPSPAPHSVQRKARAAARALALVAGLFCVAGDAAAQRSVVVDTRALTLRVVEGDTVLRSFDNIAIGSNGAAADKRARDEKTPLGEFRIDEIRESQRFLLFLSLDYPTLDHARRALAGGHIDGDQYRRVAAALEAGRPPPADTGLGGHLGIHGLGAGDPEVHRLVNWTDGCIALTNAEITELAGLVRVGTPVRIE